MYACVYCSEDKSLSVLGQKSKKLKLLGSFDVNEQVNMTWSNLIYPGIIVKIGGKYTFNFPMYFSFLCRLINTNSRFLSMSVYKF